MRKALEKQIKTIEKQGRKQIEEIEEDVKQLIKSITFAEKEQKNIPLDNLKEIFYELVVKKTGKNEEIHNSVNFLNLIYPFNSLTKDIDFNDDDDNDDDDDDYDDDENDDENTF